MGRNARVILTALLAVAAITALASAVSIIFGADFSADALSAEATTVVRTFAPEDAALHAMPAAPASAVAPITSMALSGLRFLTIATGTLAVAVGLLLVARRRPLCAHQRD